MDFSDIRSIPQRNRELYEALYNIYWHVVLKQGMDELDAIFYFCHFPPVQAWTICFRSLATAVGQTTGLRPKHLEPWAWMQAHVEVMLDLNPNPFCVYNREDET